MDKKEVFEKDGYIYGISGGPGECRIPVDYTDHPVSDLEPVSAGKVALDLLKRALADSVNILTQ